MVARLLRRRSVAGGPVDSSYVMRAVRSVVPPEPATPGTGWAAALVLVPDRVVDLGLGVVAVEGGEVLLPEHDFVPLDWAVAVVVVVGVVFVGSPVGL